ncbi:hypothetical protein KKG31_08835 [Patescibacteria group bacterium]|nr:hypothetical protein [Patescibacteria group bacterium]
MAEESIQNRLDALQGDAEKKQTPEAGEKCEIVPSKLTQDELKKLRHEIIRGKISTNPTAYDHAETQLGSSDNFDTILNQIFTSKNAQVPLGSVARIEIALKAKGWDIDKLRNRGVDSWKVDNGKLMLSAPKAGGKKDIFIMDLLPWKSLKQTAEVQEEFTHNYDLGAHDGSPKTDGKGLLTIDGSVDRTPYEQTAKTEKFYREKSEAAQLLLQIYNTDKNRFTPATQTLISKYLPQLNKISTQTNFVPTAFRAAFEKGYSADQLFGADGIYNFVLSFQRVIDAFNSAQQDLVNGKAKIALFIGTKTKNRDERYVETHSVSTEPDTLKDEGGTICPQRPEISQEPGPTPVPRVKGGKDAEHLKVTTDQGNMVPTALQFKEQIDVDVASKELLTSYTTQGAGALIEGLNRIPQNQKQNVLDKIFQNLGEKDPAKGMQLMNEIIIHEKGAQEDLVLKGLQSNIDNAPDANQKKFWTIQKLFFETSQAGDIDSTTGKLRFSFRESQEKMRETLKLLSEIDISKLPAELQEMAKQQKQYLETTMRQSISADILDTANMTLEGMMMNKKKKDTWFEDSFEELKAMSRDKIAKELKGGMDQDSEVFLATSHVLEAIRLCIVYKYPADVANGENIQNPIEHYYNKLKSGALKEIVLDPNNPILKQRPPVIKDVLQDSPTVASGKIDFDALFVDKAAEFDLYDQYQKGEEKLGEDGMWNWLDDRKENLINVVTFGSSSGRDTFGKWAGGIIAPLPQLFSQKRESFLEKKGGLIAGTNEIFPPLGDLTKFLNVNPGGSGVEDVGKLGSTERLQVSKILQLISMKHYDEARSLCIQILEDRLTAKKKPTDNEVNDKVMELNANYGEKIAAQVRIQLKEYNIDNAALVAKKIPKEGGGIYTDINDYIHGRVQGALKEMAYIKLQGEIANQFSEAETGGFSQYEKMAYDQLQYLNGHTINTVYITAEHADVVKDVSQMVVEIIIIEVATLGTASYFAGAAAVAEGGAIAARAGGYAMKAAEGAEIAAGAGSYAIKATEVGTNLARGTRLTRYMADVGAVGRIGAPARAVLTRMPRAGRFISGVSEGATWYHRGAGTLMHAASFVEMQSAMHGAPVNPASVEGASQIAMMAGTLYGLGKLQQFARGMTVGGRMLDTTTRIGQATGGELVGWRALPGIQRLSQASYRLGQLGGRLEGMGPEFLGSSLGSKALTGAEIGVEIAALHGLGEVEREAMILTGAMTEDEAKAMKDPDAFNRWAHTAGVVLGLRTWRAAKGIIEPPGYYEGNLERSRTEFSARRQALMDEGILSETVRSNPKANLEFGREQKSFFESMKTKDPFRLSKVEKFSSKIDLQKDTKAVVAMPCYVKEPNLAKTLEHYAKQTNKKFEIAICLNAGAKVPPAEFNAEVASRKAEIEAVMKKHPHLRIHTFEMHFAEPRPSLGNVRAYLAESIGRSAERAGLKDPIIISNDADILGLNEGYVEGYINKFEKNPNLDYSLGQIEWDASHAELNNMSKQCPELLIGQRIMQVTDSVMRWKTTEKSAQNIGSSGANTAYRLKSYFASGGYETNAHLAEDVGLGRRLKYMRYVDGSDVLIDKENQGYSATSKLQTSPRRALDAILNNKTVAEQWHQFTGKVGAGLDDAAAVRKYNSRAEFIQSKDIEAASKGDKAAIEKIQKRTEFMLSRLFIEYGIRDVTRMSQVLKRLGITTTTSPENWRFSSNGRGGVETIEGLSIDVEKSSGLNYLFRYYSAPAPSTT